VDVSRQRGPAGVARYALRGIKIEFASRGHTLHDLQP